MNETKLCKKLVYDDGDKPIILYGIILNDNDPFFIVFRTTNKLYSIGRNRIISINDTDKTFIGDDLPEKVRI